MNEEAKRIYAVTYIIQLIEIERKANFQWILKQKGRSNNSLFTRSKFDLPGVIHEKK